MFDACNRGLTRTLHKGEMSELGERCFYDEVIRDNQFEHPVPPRGVGYLMDFEVDLPNSTIKSWYFG